jgi:lipopolysaccharide transport system ATP-binding protein
MSDTIITVENLGKRYRLGQKSNERYTALRDVLTDKAKNLFRRNGRRNLTSDLGERALHARRILGFERCEF